MGSLRPNEKARAVLQGMDQEQRQPHRGPLLLAWSIPRLSVSLPATASAPWGLVSTMGAPVAATRGKTSLYPPCTFHHPAGSSALRYCWYPHSHTHPTRPPSPKLTLRWPHLLPPSQLFFAPSVHPPCSLSQAGQFSVTQCSSPAEQGRLSQSPEQQPSQDQATGYSCGR